MIRPDSLAPEKLTQLTEKIAEKPADFRVLQRVPVNDTMLASRLTREAADVCHDGVPMVLVDLETTGLDTESDLPIEVGIIKVYVCEDENGGRKLKLAGAYQGFEDPGAPLSEEVKAVTGITDEQLAGQAFDDEHIAALLADDPILVAHNAAFDRAFLDRRWPDHARQRWACTIKDVDWRKLDFSGRGLEILCLQAGAFYDAHRALNDVAAMAWLLNRYPWALGELLARADQAEAQVDAFQLPFEQKDAAKQAGFRWNPNEDGRGKRWGKRVEAKKADELQAWLTELGARPSVTLINARSRFSAS